MPWSDPKRRRKSVHRDTNHLGYVTIVEYPHRDIAALPEGTPFSEIVIADTHEGHVALLQRFKVHWLIQCEESYATTERGGTLSDKQALKVAEFALSRVDRGPFSPGCSASSSMRHCRDFSFN